MSGATRVSISAILPRSYLAIRADRAQVGRQHLLKAVRSLVSLFGERDLSGARFPTLVRAGDRGR